MSRTWPELGGPSAFASMTSPETGARLFEATAGRSRAAILKIQAGYGQRSSS